MELPVIHPWQEQEIILTTGQEYTNPYLDVEVQVSFTHESGLCLIRPAFWDGGQTWKVRFASPLPEGKWSWSCTSTNGDKDLSEKSGELVCVPDGITTNRFYKNGFWKISPGHRNLIHANGKAAIISADTAWGLPWRATEEQCITYAGDRHSKGFNAALLMTVQPDMHAKGPRDRTKDEGFDIGFEDLSSGHITIINPAYFQYFDRLNGILVKNGIVPILQPVFMGFGWKGLNVAGPVIPDVEYARYCRYLVARYGARPAIYLVGADGSGYESQVAAGGKEIEKWDCYKQPTGIHYRPHADNCAHQDAPWLDFQWGQTGHLGEHIPERATDMWRNSPEKAIAIGEPTYENTGRNGVAAGWWQGHEAWSNLCAGGTMGGFYGAAGLWQWRLHPNEPGHAEYFLAEKAGWREALDFEGSRYVGLVAKILEDLPIEDISPNWQVSLGRRGLLKPDILYIGYLENGGTLEIVSGEYVPMPYRVYNPKTGSVIKEGVRDSINSPIPCDALGPCIYICFAGWA